MDSLHAMPETSPERVTDPIPEMTTIEQTREKIPGLSYDFLRNLCLQHKIVHVRAGSKYLINFGRLVEYLNSQK